MNHWECNNVNSDQCYSQNKCSKRFPEFIDSDVHQYACSSLYQSNVHGEGCSVQAHAQVLRHFQSVNIQRTCLAKPRPTLIAFLWLGLVPRSPLHPLPNLTSGIVYQPWNEILVRAQTLAGPARLQWAPLQASGVDTRKVIASVFVTELETAEWDGQDDLICHNSLTCYLTNQHIFAFPLSFSVTVLLLYLCHSFFHTQMYTFTHTPDAIRILSLQTGAEDNASGGAGGFLTPL